MQVLEAGSLRQRGAEDLRRSASLSGELGAGGAGGLCWAPGGRRGALALRPQPHAVYLLIRSSSTFVLHLAAGGQQSQGQESPW